MTCRAALACFFVLLAACDKTETVTRVVNLHVTASCPIGPSSQGQYVATGDYEPPAQNHSAFLATDVANQVIDGVPSNARSLALLASPPDRSSWLGVTLVPAAGDLDMLLLPAASACALNVKVGFAGGMIFGASDEHTLIVSGASVSSNQQPKSYRVDLETGGVAAMTIGLKTSRLRAAIAPFGNIGQAVVTGGVTSSNPVSLDTAEVYDPASRDFSPQTFVLAEFRSDHAAVTLASGDVLLVGGQNQSGLVDRTERVVWDADATQWRSTESGMAILDVARVRPYALRLASGNVLVGGGFDAGGNAVGEVELLTPDGSSHVGAGVNVPARSKHAFVALDGGGALFVTAPEASDPSGFQRAWFVTESAATPIVPDVTTPLSDVKLFARAGGGALLWTGASWLAFDPWTGFSAVATPPSTGPDASSPIAAPDPGLRAWVASDGSITLWRDSVRNAFATEGPYLTPVSATSLVSPSSWPPPTFDSTLGLSLDAGASVFVSDARYLDVDVDVDAPSGAPPLVVLRTGDAEIEVGGASCPYPPASGAQHVHVERRGAFVSYTLGTFLNPCTTIAPNARVSVGLRGAGAASRALNFSVVRPDAALH